MTESTNVLAEVLDRIAELEDNLEQKFRRVEDVLAVDRQFFQIFNSGLREQHKRQNPASWFERIRTDPDLRYPHRKILDFLVGEYDHDQDDYKELHVTRIIKGARLGKNMAKAYLELLENKGYVTGRSDGYRKLYRIRHDTR